MRSPMRDRNSAAIRLEDQMTQATYRGSGVVTAVEQLAAEAGAEILRAGGNAADAAVAAAFAQGVVNPVRCGIGGGMMGQFYDAAAGGTQTLWSMGCAPARAHDSMFIPISNWGTLFKVEGALNQLGYQATVVPGFVRGAFDAFTRYGSGRVTWRDAIAPAIRLAAEGFKVYPHVYEMWMPGTSPHDFIGVGLKTITLTPESAAIYVHPDGGIYQIGEVLVQQDYATTLQRIADHGVEEFYRGETAERIAADFADHDGYLSLADLNGFQSQVYEPLRCGYRGHELITEDAPSVGPTFLEIMNILEGWDVASLGWNTPDYLDRLARAMHLAFRDRAEQIGDPLVVDVPLGRLLSKDYAASLRNAIDSGTDVAGRKRGNVHDNGLSAPSETTHVTVVDSEGNAAAITHSIGSGSGVVTPGLGFLHNNHMIQFDARPGMPNSICTWQAAECGRRARVRLQGWRPVHRHGLPGWRA